MNPTRNDIPEKAREQVCQILNARLADVIDLTLQAKQAHWNVKGPNFIALHKLFDEVYTTFAEQTDEIAERIIALGGNADGQLQGVAKRTTLPAYTTTAHDGRSHVEALAGGLAAFGKAVRLDIDRTSELKDAGSSDLFTQISRLTDQFLWFVEAHLYETN